MAHEQRMQVEKFRLERKAFFEQLGAGVVAGALGSLTGGKLPFTPGGTTPTKDEGGAGGGGTGALGKILPALLGGSG